MRFILVIIFWVTVNSFVFSQLRSKGIIEPKHSLTIELGLPNSISNKAFKEIMQGLVHVSPYYQYAFKNGLALGVGGRYSYFAINEFRVPSKVFGGMHSYGGFIKIGHEKFYSTLFAIDAGLKLGFCQNMFYSDLLRSKERDHVFKPNIYLEPNLGLILAASEVDTYRLSVGYSFLGSSFRPFDIGYDSNETIGYSEKNLSSMSTFLTIGFGYTHHFNGKTSIGFDE
ncbi:MAG: hypothetical protein RLZ10_2191 [Bacteroidota bacterium]|jgi:hypothetical protein